MQERIYDDFVTQFSKKIQELVVGNGMEPNVTMGPLINENAVEKVNVIFFLLSVFYYFVFSYFLQFMCLE